MKDRWINRWIDIYGCTTHYNYNIMDGSINNEQLTKYKNNKTFQISVYNMCLYISHRPTVQIYYIFDAY